MTRRLSAVISSAKPAHRSKADPTINRLLPADRPAHDWYRFVLSYPPHLVRDYVTAFGLSGDQVVFDPFCGTGTTIVECQKLGLHAVGFEANSMAYFASQTKTDWSPSPKGLFRHASNIADRTFSVLHGQGIEDDLEACLFRKQKASKALRTLTPEQDKLLLANSLSPLPMHKTLVLLEQLSLYGNPCWQAHERLALANALVFSISNLHFGPEVGVTPPKSDTPVVPAWLDAVSRMSRVSCLRWNWNFPPVGLA